MSFPFRYLYDIYNNIKFYADALGFTTQYSSNPTKYYSCELVRQVYEPLVPLQKYSDEELIALKNRLWSDESHHCRPWSDVLRAHGVVSRIIDERKIPYFHAPPYVETTTEYIVNGYDSRFDTMYKLCPRVYKPKDPKDLNVDEYEFYLNLMNDFNPRLNYKQFCKESGYASHQRSENQLGTVDLFDLPFHTSFLLEVTSAWVDTNSILYANCLGVFIQRKTNQLRHLILHEIRKAKLYEFRDLDSIVASYVHCINSG